jgi:hypothetical protein
VCGGGEREERCRKVGVEYSRVDPKDLRVGSVHTEQLTQLSSIELLFPAKALASALLRDAGAVGCGGEGWWRKVAVGWMQNGWWWFV